MYICISFMHNPLFTIRELINVITSNYRLVDDNFISIVIFSRSPAFHYTFWTDKVSLSFSNHSIFYICNRLHFTSFWWFFEMLIVEDHKILMRDRCIKCGVLRSLFPPPFVEPLALASSSMSLDYSLWLFSSHGFHVIMPYKFHLISVFFLVIV